MVNIKKHIILIGLILFSEVVIGAIVYFTGGTIYPFTHLIYIPIMVAGFLFHIKGAVGTALLGGLILGPAMPLDVSEGMRQAPSSWSFRFVILLFFAIVVGYLFQRNKAYHKYQRNHSYIHEMTGYPNARKLKNDINQMVLKEQPFTLMIFKITNMDQINNYIDERIGEKALFKALEMLENLVPKDGIYSIYTDEFSVAMWGCGIVETYGTADEFIAQCKEPLLIDGVPVNLAIKGGILNYPLHGTNGNSIFKNLCRVLDQAEFGTHKIAIYKDTIALAYQAKFETVIALYEALQKDQFFLVYQPIIDLKNEKMESVEALLRWNNSKGLTPDQFIQIAEDAGMISEISKWVISHVVDRLKEWSYEGVKTKAAINISSKDLKNDLIVNHILSDIKKSGIDPSLLKFELTERVMIENMNEIENNINRIKDTGIKISLDDFGTGYNSLIQFIKLPIDFVKIDRTFVEHMQNANYKSLLEELIITAHKLGQKVIAEGVESELQLQQLKHMKCDYIQGYYFSKPLPPQELKNYLKTH